jgi:hypothetical protein
VKSSATHVKSSCSGHVSSSPFAQQLDVLGLPLLLSILQVKCVKQQIQVGTLSLLHSLCFGAHPFSDFLFFWCGSFTCILVHFVVTERQQASLILDVLDITVDGE